VRDDYHGVPVLRPASPAHATPNRVDIDLLVTLLLVVVGIVVAVLDDAAPTGHTTVDAVWRGIAGALLVVCAASAPAPTWAIAALVAAVASTNVALISVGAGALVIATVGALRFARVRSIGAVVGVAVGIVAFRLPHDAPLGVSTVVALVIAAPVVIGAWYAGPAVIARLLNGLGAVGLVVSAAAAVALGFAVLDARAELETATDLIDEASDLFRDGDEQGARDRLEEGLAAFDRADGSVSKPWLGVTRAVPVIGQHTAALQAVTGEGVFTTQAALLVLDDLDSDTLTITGGAVDLDAVRALEPSVTGLALAAIRGSRKLDDVDSPWLLGAVRTGLADASDELADVTDSARRAVDAIRVAPTMLGGEGVRRHLVLLDTPAELRGSGGLIGNWALIEAVDGALRLGGVGRVEDLNLALADAPTRLTAPDSYVETYGRFSVESEFQDITVSPHFPDVAQVAAQLFEQANATTVDTVMLVDPAGVAALLALTGGVTIDDITVDSTNARDFLLLHQYRVFPTESERVRFLERMLTETFSRLLIVDFPDPWDLDEVFADVVNEDRLVIASVNAREQSLLEDLGVGGAFAPTDGDVIGVMTQNAGQNKIDTFLSRTIDYDASIDPARGTIDATVTVLLTNLATDLSLPDAVVGNNDQGFPRGTNVLELTIYSPHSLVEATLDGEESAMRATSEFGIRAYSRLLQLPPGGRAVVTMRLEGVVSLTDGYVLNVPVQPAATPDTFDITINVPPDVLIDDSAGPWNMPMRTAADQRIELELRYID
jgi:hypothetical protein